MIIDPDCLLRAVCGVGVVVARRPRKAVSVGGCWGISIPFLGGLFYEFQHPKRIKELRLAKHLDVATETLSRVNGELFFKRFRLPTLHLGDEAATMAIMYFYEPFLQAFDPETYGRNSASGTRLADRAVPGQENRSHVPRGAGVAVGLRTIGSSSWIPAAALGLI